MNSTELTSLLNAAFGARARVRARRPDRLYQIDIPASLADGDAPSIFVEPGEDGRLRISDQGMTTMRLSYTAAVSDATTNVLERLADRHGFGVVEGAIVADVRKDEVLAAALGLLQIEAEAEATITAAVARGKQGAHFRDMIRSILQNAFREQCTLDYRAPGDDAGLFSIDARIEPAGTSGVELLVAIAADEVAAESAVGTKLKIMQALPAGPTVAKTLWIAIPKDANALQSRTRMRLMQEYLVPVPRYEEKPAQLEAKLRELSA
jgi:hypothetical protein